MAIRGLQSKPYERAIGIYSWAIANWSYLDGRLFIATGTDPASLSAGRFCNAVYAVIVDDYGALADRHEVRRSLDKAFGVPEASTDQGSDAPNPDSWGTTEAAQRDNMQAMQMADGAL